MHCKPICTALASLMLRAAICAGQVPIIEYKLPSTHSGPNFIVAGPDGNLWFTEITANKIGRITTDGAITEFPVPTRQASLQGIAAGPDGNLWWDGVFGGPSD